MSFVEKSMENIVMNPINIIATFAIENLEKCQKMPWNTLEKCHKSGENALEKCTKRELATLKKCNMVNRKLDKEIENHYEMNKSALLLTGARQTGKTVNGRTLYLPIYMTMFIRKYTTEKKQVYNLDLSNLKVNA
mgnify:FL=1